MGRLSGQPCATPRAVMAVSNVGRISISLVGKRPGCVPAFMRLSGRFTRGVSARQSRPRRQHRPPHGAAPASHHQPKGHASGRPSSCRPQFFAHQCLWISRGAVFSSRVALSWHGLTRLLIWPGAMRMGVQVLPVPVLQFLPGSLPPSASPSAEPLPSNSAMAASHGHLHWLISFCVRSGWPGTGATSLGWKPMNSDMPS